MTIRRKRLVARREALGFTQESFARRIGVETSTVGRWERGLQDPQPWMRPKIAKALGVSVEELAALLSVEMPTSADWGDSESLFGPEIAEHVRRSQRGWLRVRRAPGMQGRELAELAAWLYPTSQRAPGGHVLTGPGWLLDSPVELDSVRLTFSDTECPTPGLEPVDHVLPLTARGERYVSYSRAVRDLVRPRLLENRLSYRLLEVSRRDGLALTFGTTTFFEVFDVKECQAGRDERPAFDQTPGPYTGPVPIVTHLHGGHSAEESGVGSARSFRASQHSWNTGSTTGGQPSLLMASWAHRPNRLPLMGHGLA